MGTFGAREWFRHGVVGLVVAVILEIAKLVWTSSVFSLGWRGFWELWPAWLGVAAVGVSWLIQDYRTLRRRVANIVTLQTDLKDLQKKLYGIEAGLTRQINETARQVRDPLESTLAAHDRRLGTLEQWRESHRSPGGAAP